MAKGAERGGRRWTAPLIALAVILSTAVHAVERLGDRFVDDHGEPVVLSWAFGLSSPAELKAYERCGFNTVYIDLPAPDSADPAELVRLADAAGAAGLHVIVGLNAIDAVLGDDPLPAGDAVALGRTCAWISEAVAAWKDTPGLVAYALQHEAEDRLAWTPGGLTEYLRRRYRGRVDLLSEAWRTELQRFEDATAERAARLDAERPGGVSRPSLDVAYWPLDAVAELHRLWAREVAAADPARPVLGGRMSRYRTLLAADTLLAGLQPCRLPTGADADLVFHEAGAVSVANQVGRFAVFPTISTSYDGASLRRWTRLMFARGAAGVGYQRWSDLRDDVDRVEAVRAALEEVAVPGAAGFTPDCSAALVLQPLARGPLVDGRASWGYGGFAGDEPRGLLELLHTGTRYGPLAVLTPRDLGRVRLDRYGCVIVPAGFELPPLGLESLRAYVDGGGLLVADLGLGCFEPYGDLRAMPGTLEAVFGLTIGDVRPPADVLLTRRQQDRVQATNPGDIAFPELAPLLSHPGSLVFRRRSSLLPRVLPVVPTPPEMARTLLLGPSAFVVPGPATRMLAEQAQIAVRGGRPAVAGFSEHRYGSGIACFASPWLWAEWTADEPLFESVHDGLLGRRPQLAQLVVGPALVPHGWFVARQEERLWVHHLTDDDPTLMVDLPTSQPRLYPGGLNAIRRAPPLDPNSPIQATAEPLINCRVVTVEGGELRVETTLPISLWPLADSCAAEVSAYGPEKIEVILYGQGDPPTRSERGRWTIPAAREAPLMLTIENGSYPVAPGSLHRVAFFRHTGVASPDPTVGGGHRVGVEYDTLTADPDGRIVIRGQFDWCRLTLTPVAGSPAP